MVSVAGTRLRERLADTHGRKGTLVTLRRVTVGPGGPNPPTLTDTVLDGNHSAGATSVSVRATQAVGRIVAGDQIGIGALQPINIASTAVARAPSLDPTVAFAPGVDAIALATPLPAAVSDGAPVSFSWAADRTVRAGVARKSRTIDGGMRIEEGLSITIAAHLVVSPPEIRDQAIIGPTSYQILRVDPAMVGDVMVAWLIQAQ